MNREVSYENMKALEEENASLRHALHAVVDAIGQNAAGGAIRDTLWMPKEYALNCTVVEFIGTVLEG